jgi:superfamily II DNA or RNA helicase
MGEQLPLDFSVSNAERQRRARKRMAKAEAAAKKPSLFDAPPNLDIHLDSAAEAVAVATGDADRSFLWLGRLVGELRVINRKKVAFNAAHLDRLSWVRPPAQITLDAASSAVARALWADRLGYKPLVVTKHRQRLIATSNRWPAGLSVNDAPWTAIAALARAGVSLAVDDKAKDLLSEKLIGAGVPIATAGLAGSAVSIRTTRPDLLENFELPGLAYDGMQGTGNYKMPILCAERLLDVPQIALSTELESAIRRATARTRPIAKLEGFPWTLYPFQANDVGRAMRIVETTGGVLLAAEMGAGKTTMALAMVHLLDLRPLLVVSPLSGFSTWARQLGEMGLRYHLATGSPKDTWEQIANGDDEVIVISYDRLFQFNEIIERRGFRGIIADEIQRIRTPGSRRSRALRQLAAAIPVRIGLSGTPLTNTINDLLPLGAFLSPGEWRPRAREKDLSDTYPGDPVEAVAEHLGSMMVRRRMTDVGAKLPKRNDHRIFVDLTAEQRRAIEDLQAEAERAKADGVFDGNEGRMHAFARLQKMRQIVNAPAAANVSGPNPKVRSAVELAMSFLAADRKGVIFCADRTTFSELSDAMTDAGVKHVKIWGATPPMKRIEFERQFHSDPETKVVLCTIQAGSESWSASPTATWLISTAYMYAPSLLAQMEARVYRMNSDPSGPDIEICYLHATAPGGTLDDRMVEILESKKGLFAQVVDRTSHIDDTKVHYSMSDLVYLLTGERDEALTARESDSKATVAREQQRKQQARATAHRHKGKNKGDANLVHDDGSSTVTLEEHQAMRPPSEFTSTSPEGGLHSVAFGPGDEVAALDAVTTLLDSEDVSMIVKGGI